MVGNGALEGVWGIGVPWTQAGHVWGLGRRLGQREGKPLRAERNTAQLQPSIPEAVTSASRARPVVLPVGPDASAGSFRS